MLTRLSLCLSMVLVLAVVSGAAWAVPGSAGAASGSAPGWANDAGQGSARWDLCTPGGASSGAPAVASLDVQSASAVKGSVASSESKLYFGTPELPSCALLLCALAPLAWAGMRARAKQRR